MVISYEVSEISNNAIMESKDVCDTFNIGLPSSDNVICDASSFVFLKRKRKAKNLGLDFYSFLLEDSSKTYGETIRSIDAFLKEAINNKRNSLGVNKTWFLTDLAPGSKSIGCKRIFRKK